MPTRRATSPAAATPPARAGVLLAFGLALAAAAAPPPAAAGTTERVSVGPGGVQADGHSAEPAVSADGRFVAFQSEAANLVPSDTNGVEDIFVRDRTARTTTRVSVGAGGSQLAQPSQQPAISADGRHVAYWGAAGVVVHDRQTGRNRLASLAPDGGPADDFAASPALSADGRVVAFYSPASNLVPGDTNADNDVFVRDLAENTTTRVSVGPGGAQAAGGSLAPAISADGRFVAFWSSAPNLVAGDTNGTLDVFLHDRRTGVTRRASIGPGGAEGEGSSSDPALSADGRVVAFASAAANLAPGDTNGDHDVFVRDRRRNRTERVSVELGPPPPGTDADSYAPAISADGRLVAFESEVANLVPNDTNVAIDVFVRDREAGRTTRVSVGPGGVQAAGRRSAQPAISADGRVVAFRSDARNLVPRDTNGRFDIFVHTR